MVATFASSFLGLIRYRILLHNFDTSESAIFLAAFNLPDLLFKLLIFGAVSIAFIPVFTEYLHKDGENEAFKFASNVINFSLIFFGFFALLAFIFTPFLNNFFVPGFKGEQKALTDQLTRIILVGQLFLVVGSLFIGISQSFQKFIISSLAPIFYNLGIIFGIVFLSPSFGILGPGYGVIIGALLHALVQLPFIRSLGFRYSLSFDLSSLGLKEILKMMSFRNIGLVFEQIGDKFVLALSSVISYSSVTLLTISQQLYTAPVSLFALTISQAALPVLSRERSRGEEVLFKTTLLTTMHQILFLTLPAAAILVVLRIPVVRLLFGASQFSWVDTVLTGRTVAFFALGLAAQSVVVLLIRGFYAYKDTKTPTIVSIISVLMHLLLSWVFIQYLHLEVWSLGLSSSLATILTVFLLIFFLDRRLGGFDFKSLFAPAFKMLLAALVAAIALYIPIKALDQLVIDTTRTANLILLTGIASLFGLGIYLLLVYLMDVKELETFTQLLKKFANLQKNLKTEEITQEPTDV